MKGAETFGIKVLWLNRFGKEVPEGVMEITSLLDAFEMLEI